MATASRVHKIFEQNLWKGGAAFFTTRKKAPYFKQNVFLWRYVIEVCAAVIHKPWDTTYSLNSEKYEQAIGMKYREINLQHSYLYRRYICQPDVLFHSGTLCIQTPREVARTLWINKPQNSLTGCSNSNCIWEVDPFHTDGEDCELFIICRGDDPTDRRFKCKAIYFNQTEGKMVVTLMLVVPVNYIPFWNAALLNKGRCQNSAAFIQSQSSLQVN
jgi:hypothetical protein